MKPYYEHGGITIYHGDCREILPSLASGDADGVVCDPPFGIGFSGYASHEDAPDEYEPMMQFVVGESLRIVGDGPCFFWQGMLNADKWHRWFPAGFRLFAACKGFVQYRPTPVQYAFDPVVFWGKSKAEPSVERRDWHIQRLAPFGANRPKIQHPCPRPLEQVSYVVALSGATTILDPFMGSGTTLEASKNNGRRAIGIEIEERYCEIAAKRLEQEVLPLEMGA